MTQLPERRQFVSMYPQLKNGWFETTRTSSCPESWSSSTLRLSKNAINDAMSCLHSHSRQQRAADYPRPTLCELVKSIQGHANREITMREGKTEEEKFRNPKWSDMSFEFKKSQGC